MWQNSLQPAFFIKGVNYNFYINNNKFFVISVVANYWMLLTSLLLKVFLVIVV